MAQVALKQLTKAADEEASGAKGSSACEPHLSPQKEHGTYVMVEPVSTITRKGWGGVPRGSSMA